METIPLTELDAVNMALDLIGEEPVSQTDTSGASDAASAYRSLVNESRAVQELGWAFNREFDYPLAPDGIGLIYLPNNTLFVDPSAYISGDIVQRGNRLYNRTDHTFVFDSTIKAEIILMLDYTDLPSYARSYIAIKAARKFQKAVLGSDSIDKLTLADEQRALATMVSRELNAGDYNYLDATDTRRALRRRP